MDISKFPTIEFICNPEPLKCFFNLGEPIWYPGWAIGFVNLPFSTNVHHFVLVWDASGDTHWIGTNKIKYEGDAPEFNYDYYRYKFDWNKYKTFKLKDPKESLPLVSDRPVNTHPILKAFRTSKDTYF